jgi:hypothetical protein
MMAGIKGTSQSGSRLPTAVQVATLACFAAGALFGVLAALDGMAKPSAAAYKYGIGSGLIVASLMLNLALSLDRRRHGKQTQVQSDVTPP